MDKMRVNYLKELNVYEDKTRLLEMKIPTKRTNVKIDTHYFDASEDLDMSKDIEAILNKKI